MRDRLLLTARRSAAVLAAALLVGVLAAAPALADDPAFTIPDGPVDDPVGLATDTATSSYWVVNPTGARMFALSRTGGLKGTVEFRADTVDVEAAAYRSGRLYVGDIGDADSTRDLISVFLFPNLTPDAGTVTYQSWDFDYPDGAHDAKAMVVDTTGRLFVITTGDGAGIYRAPASPNRQGTNRLERVGDAPVGVTDAVALTAGRWALRTTTAVVEIDARSYKKVAEAPLPVKNGDTLGLDLAAASGSSLRLVAGAAGGSAAVYAVARPSTATASASRTPTASGPPTAGATGEADPPEDSASDSARSGTAVAIAVAAGVAAVAGLIAYLWPSRGARAGVAPVDPAPPARGSGLPLERPVPPDPTTPWAGGAFARPHPSDPYGGGPAQQRHRAPGDIEDDDAVDDTTARADGLPGRRAEEAAPVAPSEPPRRSLGYDPELWGEETLRRRPGDQSGPPA